MKSIASATSDAPVESEVTDIDLVLNLVTCVRLEAGDCAGESLATISTVLNNLLRDPNNPKFRRLRLANPTISAKIGQYDSCKALLEVVST